MQVVKSVIVNTTVPNSAISLQISSAEFVGMQATWHATVPIDSEAPTHETLYLGVHLSEESAQETPSIERWRISCKSCQAHHPTAGLQATSIAAKEDTTQQDIVLHPRILGIDQLQLRMQHHGHATVKTVEDMSNLHHGSSHEATMVTTVMLLRVVVLLLGNNKLLHLRLLKTMAMVVINKVMARMAMMQPHLHLPQLD